MNVVALGQQGRRRSNAIVITAWWSIAGNSAQRVLSSEINILQQFAPQAGPEFAENPEELVSCSHRRQQSQSAPDGQGKGRAGCLSASRRSEPRTEDPDLFFQIAHNLLRKFSVGRGSAQLACFNAVMMTIDQSRKPLLDLSAPGSERIRRWHKCHYAYRMTRLYLSNLAVRG